MSPDTGVDRIHSVFERVATVQRAALMPYLPLGYPTPAVSLDLVEAAVVNGADMLELGVPYSDPLADGPVIQHATQVALERGMSVARCLEMVRDLRGRGLTAPFVLMGYINPVLAYGAADFCADCQASGVDGLIVPDLPPEEGTAIETACRSHGLALIYLLAPTSPPERIELVVARSQGFVYLVSVTGTTGARDRLAEDLAAFVARVRNVTGKPLAVGFGISSAEQASRVAKLADGVIVGSALVRQAGEDDPVTRVGALVRALRQALVR